MKRVQRWSLSAQQAYELCPFKYKIERLDRTGADGGYGMERGNYLHSAIEAFIKGGTIKALKEAFWRKPPMKKGRISKTVAEISTALAAFLPYMKQIRADLKKKAILAPGVEVPFAVNSKWEPVPITDNYKTTDWRPIWLSGKIDVEEWLSPTEMLVTDWKTGEYKEDDIAKYTDQLELYALIEFIIHEGLQVVHGRLAYLDEGEYRAEQTFERGEMARMKKRWTRRVAPMFKDTAFKPTPHFFCLWCAYGQARGDQRCEHGVSHDPT